MEENQTKSEAQKAKEIITETLSYLSEQAALADELFELWRRRGRYPNDPELERKANECRLRRKEKRRLKYLKEKDLVRIQKKQDKLLVELSKKGKKELVLRTMKDRPKLGLDQECLIVYDFPTTARAGRDAFRAFLKQAGCIQAQKSVWKSNRDVVSDIYCFVKKAKIKDWVEIYIAKKM